MRPPQLQAPVSKFRDRGVIRKADAERRRPFRVLGRVTPTSYDEGVPTLLSVRDSGATHAHAVTGVTRPHFRPKLSPVSPSRAAPGYGGVAIAQSVATLSQLAPMRLVIRDWHSPTRSASRYLSNQLLRRRTVGTLIARWQNDDQRPRRSWSVAARVGNRTIDGHRLRGGSLRGEGARCRC